MVLHRLALLAALSSTTLAAGLTGGETYASTRRTSAQSNVVRSTSAGLVQDGVSFTIGSGDDGKVFYSPTASSFKSHTLTGNWGLEAVAGKVFPVTVFTVGGNVTCDTLGDMVADYLSKDDVFDEVSLFSISSSFHHHPRGRSTGKRILMLAQIFLPSPAVVVHDYHPVADHLILPCRYRRCVLPLRPLGRRPHHQEWQRHLVGLWNRSGSRLWRHRESCPFPCSPLSIPDEVVSACRYRFPTVLTSHPSARKSRSPRSTGSTETRAKPSRPEPSRRSTTPLSPTRLPSPA